MANKTTVRDFMKNNNNLFIERTTEQEITDTKLTIISLAYTDALTANNLYELSDILSIIAQNKAPNKRKDYK